VGVLQHSGKIASGVIEDAVALADMCQKTGAKLCAVSSSEVYGGGQSGLCDETMECRIGPEPSARREYAVGKLAAEVALQNLARDGGLDVRIVRPFNVTGPRQSPRGGFVLPRFVLQALTGKPLTVYGDGSQVRAFTHVTDIVQGLVAAMDRGAPGEIYNLGNPENRITIEELATCVAVRGSLEPAEIQFVDPKALFGDRFAEANDKYPDAQKAFDQLGWRPNYDVRRIVVDVIRYWEGLRRDNPLFFDQMARLV
jgi:UDP-glucose 4-epimerase